MKLNFSYKTIILICAFLCTIGMLYAVRPAIFPKEILVQAKIEAEKPFTAQIFYTENDEESFNEDQSVQKEVPVGNSSISITLPIEKLWRFRFDFGSFPGTVKVKNMKLIGDETVSLDFNDFTFNQYILNHTIKGDELAITSNDRDPNIRYKKPVKLMAKTSIDWCVLIILGCFFFFIFGKLFLYMADFKISQKHSRIDIVLLVVFFGLLFIPMLHISDAEKSEAENRMLAQKPKLIEPGALNNKFGEKFNDWFSDRFWGRDNAVMLYSYLKFGLNMHGESRTAHIGQDGWLFGKQYNSVDMYRNANLFNDAELKTLGEHMNQFVKDAHKAGIKQVYFMLSNDKESMYPEYYPTFIKKKNKQSRLEQTLAYLHQNYPDMHVLNFKDKLDALKQKEIIFYKTGTHMNQLGAFYEYYYLTNEIKKDFPSVSVLTLDQCNIEIAEDMEQDLYKSFFVIPGYDKPENLKNKVLSIDLESQTQRVEKSYGAFINGNNKNVKNGLKVFAITDSFLGRYYEYLLGSFSKVDRIFFGSGNSFVVPAEEKNYLWKNIPDILIVASAERFLQRFLTLEFPKEN